MLKKAYTPLSLFVEAFALLIVGILFFAAPEETLTFVASVAHIIFWVIALVYLFRWITKRNEERPAFGQALLMLALAAFLTANPYFLTSSMSLVFAVWILINAIAKFLYAAQLWKTKSGGFIWANIEGVVYTLFSVSIFFDLVGGAVSLSWLLGIYCLLSALFTLADAFRELLGTDIKGKRVKQRVRIKPPVILTLLTPMSLLRALDDPDEEAEIAQWTRKETVLEDRKPDLEIFLHLGNNVAFGFGHVDIAMDGKVYTYGCYDETSNRLFGILSDGVFFDVNRDAYIDFSLKQAKKRLIGYGVVLTDEQKQAIKNKISDFLEGSTVWHPTDKNPNQKILAETADAHFYKIGKGPFKTYNVLSTNCVAAANILSGSGGVDLMNPQGIITPGTYAEFLDRQFLRKKSIVISRTLYR